MNRGLKYQIDLNDGTFGRGMSTALKQTEALDNAVGKIGATLGIAFSIDKFKDLAEHTTDVHMKMQAFDNVLKFASKDSADYAENQKFLKETVKNMHLPIMETSEGFSKLLGSMKGTNLEGEASRKIFKGASEAITVNHLSAEQANSVYYAMQNIMSKGTLQAQELTLQLGNALPGAQKLAADAMGLTTKELMKQMEKGEVMAEDFLPRFAQQLEKVYGPGMANAVESLTSKMNDANTAIIEQEDAMGNRLSPVWLKFLEIQGQLLEGGNKVIDFFNENEHVMGALARVVALGTLAWMAQTVALKINLWFLAEEKLALVAAMWAEYGLEGAILAVNAAMAANPFGAALAGLILLVGGLDLAIQRHKDLAEEFDKGLSRKANEGRKEAIDHVNTKVEESMRKNPKLSYADALDAAIKDERETVSALDRINDAALKKAEQEKRKKNGKGRVYGNPLGLKDDLQNKIDEANAYKIKHQAAFGALGEKDIFTDPTSKLAADAASARLKAGATPKAGSQSVPGGSNVRNVNVTIQNLVKDINYLAGGAKENAADLEKQITEIIVRAVRNSELAL